MGGLLSGLAVFSTFSTKVTAIESASVSRDEVKTMVEDLAPWLRDKGLVLQAIDRLEQRQLATETTVNSIMISQSRIEERVSAVGEDVRTILKQMQENN
jgi:flagellar biosynthesis/type III secretory pathway chaperone